VDEGPVVKVGVAQVEITPVPGLQLAGFAVRPQPSVAILDPLWIRALYLEWRSERFLWLHADLLALKQSLVDRLRSEIEKELGIPRRSILLSTTHTHSAPATIQLTRCGEMDKHYVSLVEEEFRRAARLALLDQEDCNLVLAEGNCDLGIDRREFASAHTDPRVGALAWRRADGSFKAVVLNYAMHPVCLRGNEVSGDWPGEASRFLSTRLLGSPVAFVTPGACANIDPPAVGVKPEEMIRWGRQIAESVVGKLIATPLQMELEQRVVLRTQTITVALPTEQWTACEVESYAASCLADPAGFREFGENFRAAVETWRKTMIERLHRGEPPVIQAELGLVWFGMAAVITVNAEVFSQFTGLASTNAGCPVYTVSCANGMLGYIPAARAYDEGAYEVSWAMLFYNMPRPEKSGLELLAAQARRLIAAFQFQTETGESAPVDPSQEPARDSCIRSR
jgi:neutral ceramidase